VDITLKGIKIFCERGGGTDASGGGTDGRENAPDVAPVVLLHGWGACGATMRILFDGLKADNRAVFAPDLPFFGQSEPPPESWGVYDYADLAADLIRAACGGAAAVVIGHSFGGRLGIILAAKYPELVQKLVLIDAAGCKPKIDLKKRLKIIRHKIRSLLGLKPERTAGSADYRALPDNMKGVFVRVVNESLEPLFGKIGAPTLIIWGDRDRDTPPYMARRMNKKIRGSGLVMLAGAGHYSFLDAPTRVLAAIKSFIGQRMEFT
jgi:pimeloyl-ACP methyl ester carboxylesterase